jgi:hypothetical protein
LRTLTRETSSVPFSFPLSFDISYTHEVLQPQVDTRDLESLLALAGVAKGKKDSALQQKTPATKGAVTSMRDENNKKKKIKTILILGGYGNAGLCIARHLVRETTTTTSSSPATTAVIGKTKQKDDDDDDDIHIVIAGRDEGRAKQVALQIGRECNCPNRIHWRRVDATDTNSLDAAFSCSSTSLLSSTQEQQGDDDNAAAAAAEVVASVDMVVVASSTTSSAKFVAEAALRHHVDYYFDIQISSSSKIRDLMALEPQIRAAKACFVTDGGVHPGVPGALVRYAQQKTTLAAKNVDNSSTTTEMMTTGVLSANVYIAFRCNWKEYKFSPATQMEFMEELCQMKPLVYRNGAWVDTAWTCTPTFDFGPPFGTQTCVPMYLQEMQSIAEENKQQVMQEMGVYISGFNWITDYIVLPLALLVLHMFPNRVCARRWLHPVLTWLFAWSLKAFSKPPYGGKIVLEAMIGSTKYQTPLNDDSHCRKTRLRLELAHQDVYEATAIPAVATILQLLDRHDDNDFKSSSSSLSTASVQAPPGLQYQAQLVEPRRFLQDMQRLGMEVNEETTTISSE